MQTKEKNLIFLLKQTKTKKNIKNPDIKIKDMKEKIKLKEENKKIKIKVNISHYTLLLFLLILTSLFDAISTYLVLYNGGIETNPILNNILLGNNGLFYFFLLKGFLFPFILFAFYYALGDIHLYLFNDFKKADSFTDNLVYLSSAMFVIAGFWNIFMFLSIILK